MRAVVCHELGSPEILRLEERDAPVPMEGEVGVALEAWGVNFVDVLMVAGGYQLKPPLPFVPGLEAAGQVNSLGEGVSGLKLGDRVIVGMRPGAFAEQVVVPVKATMPVPAGMSMEQGACFRSAFQTAYHGLVQGGRLQPGETALIHGASGGMGMAAVQVAKRLGATVVATAGSLSRLEVAKQFGADHVVSYADGNFRDQVRDLVGGVDVVFDPVGGDVFDESMRCLNWGARLVIVGFTSGRAAEARTNHVLIKGASVVGIRAGEFSRRNPEIGRANQKVIWEWAEQGLISSHVSHRFALENIAAAMEVIQNREVVGRVVLHR
ncbi:MAG: NADPH:quinone oxidoreductase family protein [Chromatiales bacterium]|jgi:NADPH:quinone reductase|nr:NADPH:quinone oxidoreductase family protein [Chromatiales bacterium]